MCKRKSVKLFLIIIYYLLFASTACSTLNVYQNQTLSSKYSSDWCKTKYPVLLIHGIALKDHIGSASYWGQIPDNLETLDCTIFFGGQSAYNSHKMNAELIAQRIELILKEKKTDKVNIIAHSKGGIEARYLISVLGYESKVASLTTICTPHNGSSIADLIYAEVESNEPLKDILIQAASVQAISIGEINPDPFNAGQQLTTAYMHKFNNEVPDSSIVYYQSYAARIRKQYPEMILKTLNGILYEYEGDNDGLVSVESAKWGNYMGLILEDDSNGLSHADVIDLLPKTQQDRNKIYDFYIQLVHDLKMRGY